jgi:hypothetical protein
VNTKPQWLVALGSHLGEIEDAYSVADDGLRAYAVLHEHDPNDEHPLAAVLRGLYNEIDYLRRENNRQDANADSVITELRGDVRKLQVEYAALRKDRDRAEDQANLNAKTANDFFRKNEALRAENAKLRAELDKIIQEFFPAPIIPEPWQVDPKSVPQGEWVLRSNESLRNEHARLRDEVDGLRVELHAAQQINRDLTQPDGELAKINTVLRGELVKTQGRVIFLQTQCAENARKYERQVAVKQSQYARLTLLRFQLRRIVDSDTSMAQALRLIARETLNADDRTMGACTDIQEAKG